MLPRVLIANKNFPEAGLRLLRARTNVIISTYSDEAPESKEELRKLIQGVDAVIWCTKHRLAKVELDLAGPGLKCVSTMSSGLDHMDMQELKARNIATGNSPTVLNAAVADIAVGLLICAARRFKEGVWEVERGEWKYGLQMMVGQDIEGSTVGVVGLGGLGQTIVKRLKGFDVKTFLYCGHKEKPEGKELGAEFVSFERILKESDFIILSCPLSDETRNLINSESIAEMKPTATLINVGRGEIVDQDALVKALKERRIWAAGLDVVVPEPLSPDHPLVHLPNCFLVPHLGSATTETRNKMAIIAANNILGYLDHQQMVSPV